MSETVSETVADRAGTTQPYYGQIESGRTRMPNAELRRSISNALGIRHVDFLVEVGELGDWELPGFSPTAPDPDPERDVIETLLDQIDLSIDRRASTLAALLEMFRAQDRARRHSDDSPTQRASG